jgi:hypothetical protein
MLRARRPFPSACAVVWPHRRRLCVCARHRGERSWQENASVWWFGLSEPSCLSSRGRQTRLRWSFVRARSRSLCRGVVHAIAWADEDLHFGHALAQDAMQARIALYESIDANLDARACHRVPQPVDLVAVDRRHPDVYGERVAYRIQLRSRLLGCPSSGLGQKTLVVSALVFVTHRAACR